MSAALTSDTEKKKKQKRGILKLRLAYGRRSDDLFVDVANRHAPLMRIRTKGGLKPWNTKDIKELMLKRLCTKDCKKIWSKLG